MSNPCCCCRNVCLGVKRSKSCHIPVFQSHFLRDFRLGQSLRLQRKLILHSYLLYLRTRYVTATQYIGSIRLGTIIFRGAQCFKINTKYAASTFGTYYPKYLRRYRYQHQYQFMINYCNISFNCVFFFIERFSYF